MILTVSEITLAVEVCEKIELFMKAYYHIHVNGKVTSSSTLDKKVDSMLKNNKRVVGIRENPQQNYGYLFERKELEGSNLALPSRQKRPRENPRKEYGYLFERE